MAGRDPRSWLALVLGVDVVEVGVAEEPPLKAVVVPLLALGRLFFRHLFCSHLEN